MIAWLGTLCGILGAYIVALGFALPGYSLFAVSSLIWLTIAYAKKDLPLGVLNGFFFVANIIGLYRAII